MPTVDYAIRLEEVAWGGLLIAITLSIHAFGMLMVLRVERALKRPFERSPSFGKGIAVIILESWLILIVHLIEVGIWARFLFWKGALPTPSLAYYFSLNQYTTVGSGYSLPLRWRLLEGMLAMAGLLTFAWSTGILFTLATDFQEEQLKLIEARRQRRSAARNASSSRHE
jgi:hypothetical protein